MRVYLTIVMLFALFITSSVFGGCLTIEEGLERLCARSPKEDSTCNREGPQTYGFHLESCYIEDKEELISDIMALKSLKVIPTKIWRRYEEDRIVKTILYRSIQQSIRNDLSEHDLVSAKRDIYKDSQLQIAFNSEIFGLILKGGFKNQHQTKSSNGTNNRPLRANLEDGLIDLKLVKKYPGPQSLKVNKLRPKYSFLGFSSFFPGYKPGYVHSYGDVIAVLKDDVKKRSTMTFGDSFNHFGIAKKWNLYYEYPLAPTIPTTSNYLEAQIWGSLDHGDISHLLVGCWEKESSKEVLTVQKLKEAMKKYEVVIPIYQCRLKADGDLGMILEPSKEYN